MQEQKLNQLYILALQATYTSVEIGLATIQGNNPQIFTLYTIHKHEAIRDLIPTLESLLKKEHLSLSHISFCIINRGPSPYNTLRIVIATANALAHATGIPLMPINSFTSLFNRYSAVEQARIWCIFDAFAGSVYLSNPIQAQQDHAQCIPIAECIRFLNNISSPITLIGNGIQTFYNQLISGLSDNATLITDGPTFATLQDVIEVGYAQYQTQSMAEEISPLYVKLL